MVDHGAGVKSTEEAIEEIETSLSRERLGTYLDAAGGDRERAIRFHAWNTAVSAAFYGPLQGLEVALRNAMHRQLAERYGPAWYDNPDTGIDKGALDRVVAARSELARADYGNEASRVVAALSFGFWVSLTRSRGPARVRTQGELRDDALAAGIAPGVSASRDADAQAGPPPAERFEGFAQPDRASRTDLRAGPGRRPQAHPRCGWMDIARAADVDRMPQPGFGFACAPERHRGNQILRNEYPIQPAACIQFRRHPGPVITGNARRGLPLALRVATTGRMR